MQTALPRSGAAGGAVASLVPGLVWPLNELLEYSAAPQQPAPLHEPSQLLLHTTSSSSIGIEGRAAPATLYRKLLVLYSQHGTLSDVSISYSMLAEPRGPGLGSLSHSATMHRLRAAASPRAPAAGRSRASAMGVG
jgi:hypothetical protein